jgi:hypothetical protein
MARRMTALVLIVALAGLIASPVEAKKKRKPAPVAVTYYLNWLGDCAGSGFMALEPAPNPDSCALFFPGLGDTYSFPGSEGLPFALDATEPITVDFGLGTVASVAAEFEAVLSGTVDGEDKQIASGTQTVVAAGPGTTPVHFDLEADPALDNTSVTALTLTINWTGGVTYSSMQLEEGGANMVIHGIK